MYLEFSKVGNIEKQRMVQPTFVYLLSFINEKKSIYVPNIINTLYISALDRVAALRVSV